MLNWIASQVRTTTELELKGDYSLEIAESSIHREETVTKGQDVTLTVPLVKGALQRPKVQWFFQGQAIKESEKVRKRSFNQSFILHDHFQFSHFYQQIFDSCMSRHRYYWFHVWFYINASYVKKKTTYVSMMDNLSIYSKWISVKIWFDLKITRSRISGYTG